MMNDITFQHPSFFFLLLIIPFYIAWYIWKRKTLNPTMQISTLAPFEKMHQSWRSKFRHGPLVLRTLAIATIIAVLARPQSSYSIHDEKTEGIDIVMALDISGSMLALDFQPDRLGAAKAVATRFISNRSNDNIGLVVFAGESFTQCPLTTDHKVLTNLMTDVSTEMLSSGTAIGEGLATSVARLKESKAKSKVVILLTDGMNNRGSIAPLKAAQIAKTFGVRVYTIGVGKHGVAKIPVQTVFGTQLQEQEVEIDEDVLTEIANETGGKYFRATNNKSLNEIYDEIDQMEKTILEVREYSKRTEEYPPFALAAMILLLLEIGLRNTILRTLP